MRIIYVAARNCWTSGEIVNKFWVASWNSSAPWTVPWTTTPPMEEHEGGAIENANTQQGVGVQARLRGAAHRPSLLKIFLTNGWRWMKAVTQHTEISEWQLHAGFYRGVAQCTASRQGCGANGPDRTGPEWLVHKPHLNSWYLCSDGCPCFDLHETCRTDEVSAVQFRGSKSLSSVCGLEYANIGGVNE